MALAACGSDSTGPSSTFSGDYVLQSINGKPLPYTWTYSGGNYYRLNSYRFTILPGKNAQGFDGGWISAVNYTYTDQGQVINQPNGGEAGNFNFTESSGFVVLLSFDETTFLTGTLSGNTLTITEAGDVWVFKR